MLLCEHESTEKRFIMMELFCYIMDVYNQLQICMAAAVIV